MALGTIYTELDLDFSKYEKNQYKVLESAKATSLSIEKNFQSMGVRSDAIFQAMANGAINSYNMIAHSAKASAAEQFRTQSALISKINTLNIDAAKNPLFSTLGIRSQAEIQAQKNAVIASYETIKNSGQATARDLVNIERAKNQSIIDLDRELTGTHEMSMASMTRAVLRLYAAYFVVSTAVQSLISFYKKGIDAVEQYEQSVASLAASVVTFSERQKGQDLAGQWKDALLYAQGMVPVLEEIAARTLLSGQETIALANAFARSGVFLDANNKKQIEGFTRISNALPLMTQGQEIMRQINTEIRSLLTGQNTVGSMLLITLKAIDPEIENHLKIWREEDTVLEHIGDMLAGFGPATEMLEKQWQATKTTLETTATQILRGLMRPAYEELILAAKGFNGWLEKNKDSILSLETPIRKIISIIKEEAYWLLLFSKVFMGSPYNSAKSQPVAPPPPVPSPPPGRKGSGGTSEDASAAALAKRWASTLSDIQLGFNNINVDPMIQELSKVDKQIKEWRTEFGGKVPGFDTAMVQYQASETSKIITKYANEDFDAVNKITKESADKYKKQEKEKADFAISQGSWLLEQRSKEFDALVEMAKQKSERIIAVEKWEYDQREKKYEEFWNNLVGMANELSGDAGVGAGKVAGGLKGITDISAGVDKYSQEMEVAYKHYQDMQELYWTDYENHKEVADAWFNYEITSERALREQKISIAQNTMGMLAGTMQLLYAASGEHNKKMFTAYKAFAMAEAIISTMAGAARALKDYPAPYSYAVAAVTTAFGLARVAQIASLQPGSSTTGSASSAGGGVTISNPNETTSTTTTSTQRAQGIQIYIYGNVYDEKKLARELQPYLTQAQNDGVQ